MTVRRAVLEDIPKLMELARQEHERSQFHNIPFDETRAHMSFEHFINSLGTVVFISEGGFIAGMIQPLLFSRMWNAYETCWFAKDGSGLALLAALKDWADKMRALALVVHNYAGVVSEERFEKVMTRAGYKPLGATYVQQLGDI